MVWRDLMWSVPGAVGVCWFVCAIGTWLVLGRDRAYLPRVWVLATYVPLVCAVVALALTRAG